MGAGETEENGEWTFQQKFNLEENSYFVGF